MKSESEPITDDDWLIRRVHKMYWLAESFPFIIPEAFRPREKGDAPDLTGISVHRLSCLQCLEESLAKVPADKLGAAGLVRFQVSELTALGWSVVTEADNDDPIIPGHCVIPELSVQSYEANKQLRKLGMATLAELASRPNCLVLVPPQLRVV